METIAVYREEQVKVYGITEKADFALAILHFPGTSMALWGRRIMSLEQSLNRFELVTCHTGNSRAVELHILFDPKYADPLCSTVNALIKEEKNTAFTLKQPVDVLFLFGPHFQDRYGIVDIAFNALRKNDVEILVSGCAGTSMYFVTSKNEGRKGFHILADTFLIPTRI